MADRYSTPDAEGKYAWLPPLLDTYYTSDVAVEEDLAQRDIKPACHSGCHACCLKPTVPVTAPELIGISWFASEVLAGELRAKVKQRLIEHESRLECPFLIDRKCSIYPMRPLACRQFLVTQRPCEIGEDPLETRPGDIVKLTREKVIRPTAMRLLEWPGYGLRTTAAKRTAFESGFIAANARDMDLYPWEQIAQTMERFEPG